MAWMTGWPVHESYRFSKLCILQYQPCSVSLSLGMVSSSTLAGGELEDAHM